MVTVTLNPAIDHAITVPGFRANTVNRATTAQAVPGGKGINVASFLAALGVSTTVTGFLGRANAKRFEAHFATHGLVDRFVRVEGETRSNLKILNPISGEATEINFPGLIPSAEHMAELQSALDELAQDHEWFVLSGSLPPGLPGTTYRSLVRRLRDRGCQVLVDASGDGLRHVLTASPSAIKPNTFELEEALGTPITTEADLLNAGRTLVAHGIDSVVVSRGAQGALFVGSQAALTARYTGQVTIETTVGAGDALVAGYLAARAKGLTAESTARLAIAASIAALERRPPTVPSSTIIESITPQVEVRLLAG